MLQLVRNGAFGIVKSFIAFRTLKLVDKGDTQFWIELILCVKLRSAHLSLAVARASPIAFQVQACQVQRVESSQHLHGSHIESSPLCCTHSWEAKIPEYTPLHHGNGQRTAPQ